MGNYYIITTEGRLRDVSAPVAGPTKSKQVTGVMNSPPGITHGVEKDLGLSKMVRDGL